MSELERFARRYEVEAPELRRWIIEAMVLGAVADGEMDRRESAEIMNQVATHAEFTGMDREELRASLEKAFNGVIADGFHVRLHALAGALTRYAHRVLAFRSSVAVAVADGQLDDEEFAFLRDMQKVLGIAEADVSRAFDELQPGSGSWVPADVEPIEAYLDVLLMAAACDGSLQEEEHATIIAFVVSRDEFEGLDEGRIREYINAGLSSYAHGGIGRRLETLADELTLPEQRETAYGLAASICASDGDLADAEMRFLGDLRQVLAIDDARADLAMRAARRSADDISHTDV